jgi:hypothetical protein
MDAPDPNRQPVGNLVVVNSTKKISGIDRATALSGEQKTDCSGLLAMLAEKWELLFHPGMRISDGSMRIDCQRLGTHNGHRCVITAVQNNLGEDEGGMMNRDHVFVYASVLIDERAQAEKADTVEAMRRAYNLSLSQQTVVYIELAREPSGPATDPTTIVFVCPRCKAARTLPADLMERARIEGCYPPRDVCPNLGCRGTEMVRQGKP